MLSHMYIYIYVCLQIKAPKWVSYKLMGHIKIHHSNPLAGPRRSSMSMGGGGWKVLGGAIGGAGACQWIHPGWLKAWNLNQDHGETWECER